MKRDGKDVVADGHPENLSESSHETDTVIVGAGPSGLALGACLRRGRVPFILLERSEHSGSAWRNHYERLHLHTVKKHSSLPFLPFPRHVGKYPSRQDVVDYLDAYTRAFDLRPRFKEEVVRVHRTDGAWETVTKSSRYRSARVVVATGYNRRPFIPEWPGMAQFRGEVTHSVDYRNGEPCRGKRVLVVGIGNTGGEIAIDLHEHGAADIAVCVRSPINVIPRDIFGTPAQVSGIWLSRLPERMSDFIGMWVTRLAVGDLSSYGIHRPNISPAAQVNKFGRVPLIDIGTVDLIKRGIIHVVPGIDGFTESSVTFVDGSSYEFDRVILATGYRPALEEFLENAAALTDERGYPIPPAGESSRPGLYFLGYANPSTGLLRQIAIDAQRVGAHIAEQAQASGYP